MSQQFIDALQWLQILSGVGYGLVSTSDVDNIAKRLGIPDDSIPKLKEYLNTKGMDIIPCGQKADLLTSLSAASVPAPRYHRFDTVLDELLDSSPQTEFMGYWLERLYRGRTSRNFSRVVFLKLAGVPTENIAVTLQLPIERIYFLEYRAVEHYRSTLHAFARQRARDAHRK